MSLKRLVSSVLIAGTVASVVVPVANAELTFNQRDGKYFARDWTNTGEVSVKFVDEYSGNTVDPWWLDCKWQTWDLNYEIWSKDWQKNEGYQHNVIGPTERQVSDFSHITNDNRHPAMRTNMMGLVIWDGKYSHNATKDRQMRVYQETTANPALMHPSDRALFIAGAEFNDQVGWTVGRLRENFDKPSSWMATDMRTYASKPSTLENSWINLKCGFTGRAERGYKWNEVPDTIPLVDRTKASDEMGIGTADYQKVVRVSRKRSQVRVSKVEVPKEYNAFKPVTVPLKGNSPVLAGSDPKGANVKVGDQGSWITRTWDDKVSFAAGSGYDQPAWLDHWEFVGTSNKNEVTVSRDDTERGNMNLTVKAVPAWSGVKIKMIDAETGKPVTGVTPTVETLSTLGVDQRIGLTLPASDLKGEVSKSGIMPGQYRWSVPKSDKWEAHTEQTTFGTKNYTSEYKDIKITPAKGKIKLAGSQPGTYTLRSKDFGNLPTATLTVDSKGNGTSGDLHWGTWEISGPGGTKTVTVAGRQTVSAQVGKLPTPTQPKPTNPTNPDEGTKVSQGTVSGVLKDANGVAVANMGVTLTDDTGKSYPSTTDADGKFTLTVPYGTYTLTDEAGTVRVPVVVNDKTINLGEVSPSNPNGSDNDLVEGTVRIGVGVPGVRVGLIKDGEVIAEGVSDDNGIVTFEDVPKGVYTVAEIDENGNVVSNPSFKSFEVKVNKKVSSKDGKDGKDGKSGSSGNLTWWAILIGVLGLIGGGISMWWAHLTPEQRLSFLPPVN